MVWGTITLIWACFEGQSLMTAITHFSTNLAKLLQ